MALCVRMRTLGLILLLAGCNAANAANSSSASNQRNYGQYIYSATSATDAGLSTGTLYTGPTPCIEITVYADGGLPAGSVTINDILVDGTVVASYTNIAIASAASGTITWWGPGHLICGKYKRPCRGIFKPGAAA